MTQKIDTGSLAIVGGIAIPYMATKDNLLRFIISAIIMAIYIGTIIAISKRKQELWGGRYIRCLYDSWMFWTDTFTQWLFR